MCLFGVRDLAERKWQQELAKAYEEFMLSTAMHAPVILKSKIFADILIINRKNKHSLISPHTS